MCRVAYYSHDTFGLGHLIRSLKLADALAARLTSVEGRIITGSPWVGLFPLPPRHEVVRLPEVVKRGLDLYEPRQNGRGLSEVIAERRSRILDAVSGFDPDLLVVDNVPCGLEREVLPSLRWLASRGRGRAVLALRDIIDEEAAVRAQWERMGAPEVMSALYDEIWVFGLPEINDVRRAYSMPAAVARKVRFCGYLGPRGWPAQAPAERRGGGAAREQEGQPEARAATGALALGAPERGRRLEPPGRAARAVLTAGGGGDARPLVSTFLAMHRWIEPPLACRVILGPDFPHGELSPGWGDRQRPPALLKFVLDVPAEIAAADVTVSMAGYNTLSEILALGARAVLVPRVHPRKEQWLRAQAFRRRAGTRILHPGDLSPQSLAQAIRGVLDSPRPDPVAADGGAFAAARAVELIGSAAAAI